LTGSKLSADARERIRVMVSTNNGFEIAEKDLELRGPGDIGGTRQSGALNFKLAHIVQDRPLLEMARNLSGRLLAEDPDLVSAENLQLQYFLRRERKEIMWSKIS
jgi:ATP-dependent DNA helicase RecG